MQIITHVLETKATPEQIWKIWEDVENWKTWDREIEHCQIDGPFQAGTTGFIKFIGTPTFKTLLTRVEPEKTVVQETYLFLATIISNQSIQEISGKTRITFQVHIKGPLSFFYTCALGRSIKKKVPIEMEEMLKKAEALTPRA